LKWIRNIKKKVKMPGSSENKKNLLTKKNCDKFKFNNLNTQLQPLSLNNIIPKPLAQSQSNIKAAPKSIINNTRESSSRVHYGELIVRGYNGKIAYPTDPKDPFNELLNSSKDYLVRRKSKFTLKKRSKPNGVKPDSQHSCKDREEINVINCIFKINLSLL
jgi:hypothetical protein